MRIFIRLVIVVIFLGVVFGGIFGWKMYQSQQMQAQMSQPQPPAKVAVAKARNEQWRPSLTSTGSVKAVSGISVTTEIAGKVSRINFESSSRVTAGDVLIQLDDSVDQAALTGLKADRQLARTQFERSSNLLPKRAVSQSQYDEAKARFDSAQAQVAQQQAQIAKKTIRAPFTGLLGLKQVDQGEYISPGTPIVTLQSLDPIHVDYSVPERQFDRIAVGRKVEIVVDAYPERTFSGRISAIDSGVNEATRTVSVRATLDNPDDLLRPGMFAEVKTLNPQQKTVVTVPRTAISYNTYGDYVYRIKSGDGDSLKAARQQVTTGAVRNGRVEITEGVSAGDRIVAKGLVKLRNGQPVAIDENTDAADRDGSSPSAGEKDSQG